MKYIVPDDQGEILPNLLGLTSKEDINDAEFEGFLKAEIYLTEHLSSRTKFNVSYILMAHKMALEHLYSFAGKLRDVNISKAGFLFPSALYLSETMSGFDLNILSKLPNKYDSKEELIKDIAIVHGELLFIHPFREGNGRTAPIIANLMTRKAGFESLNFNKIDSKEFDKYVLAVQSCANKDYDRMIELIKFIFPS